MPGPAEQPAPLRHLLVTGASRGIGRAVTLQALARGWRVIGLSRTLDPALVEQPGFSGIEIDLAQLDALPSRLHDLLRTHPQIDALLCNAGIGRFGSLEEFSPEQIRTLIDLNLTSQILTARTLLPHLKRQPRADLVLMGSEAALRGGQKGSIYCATKFALRGFAQSLREECAGSRLRVGLINPGMVDTPFFDALSFRPGEAENQHLVADDVASAILLMLSARPGASFDEINLTPQQKVIRFGPKPPLR